MWEALQKDNQNVKTLLIGVGNPFLGDDGVGAYIVKKIESIVGSMPELDVKTVSTSGIHLLEEILGYDNVILVDGIVTDGHVGHIYKLRPNDLAKTTHLSSPHDLNFASAYEMGMRFSADSMPKSIEIYGIEIRRSTTFSQDLSPAVRKSAESVVNMILESLTSVRFDEDRSREQNRKVTS